MTTITISLPDSLKAFVEAEVSTKGFGNVSEYFRGLIRDAQSKAQQAQLEALLLEGLASKAIPLDASFRASLQNKVEAIIARHADRDHP